ncbi:GtrA family protein [Polynucleobacter paneuropaeus]|nr:GtrA family protein [Polynucleobacter paneuropaeus]
MSFLITGGIAAAVNFLSRIFYNQYCSFSSSVIYAYLTGMITAFILAKIFVFKSGTQSVRRSAIIFALVNVVAAAQTWLISIGLNYYFLPMIGLKNFVPEISSAVGIVFPVFTSYLGHKHWSFK